MLLALLMLVAGLLGGPLGGPIPPALVDDTERVIDGGTASPPAPGGPDDGGPMAPPMSDTLRSGGPVGLTMFGDDEVGGVPMDGGGGVPAPRRDAVLGGGGVAVLGALSSVPPALLIQRFWSGS